MLIDASIVFVEVCAILALAVGILWLVAKVAGYVAMVFEGEPLVPGIRSDIAITRRQLRRRRARGRASAPDRVTLRDTFPRPRLSAEALARASSFAPLGGEAAPWSTRR